MSNFKPVEEAIKKVAVEFGAFVNGMRANAIIPQTAQRMKEFKQLISTIREQQKLASEITRNSLELIKVTAIEMFAEVITPDEAVDSYNREVRALYAEYWRKPSAEVLLKKKNKKLSTHPNVLYTKEG